jgi:hypothetical protein
MVGNGKTPHIVIALGKSLCTGTEVKTANVADGNLRVCGNCVKAFTPNTTTQEENSMAKATETKTEVDPAQVKADVENIIDVLGTLSKDDGEQITSLMAQANAELLKLSANKRAPLSMRLKEAVASAKDRKANAAELVVHKPTEDVTTIEGYADIVDNAADRVAEGIKSEVDAQSAAKTVASAIFDGRLRIYNKKGMPDLKGTRQAAKDLANNIYTAAAHKLVAQGYRSEIADVDELLKGLQNKVQYQMTAVIPEFVRGLDDDRVTFGDLFPQLAEALAEDAKPSDTIFEFYGINRKSKAELAADRRAAAKELANGGGEGSGEGEGEGEGEGDGEETETKTPAEKLTAALERDTKALDKIKVEELTDAEADKLRAQMLALSSKVQEIALKLSARK